MWQYIPEAAVKYGLKVGPVVDLQLPDPGDERHRVDLPTKARHLKDLYSTDAQASVLLVMESYNRGEDQVLPLIRSMPANPKDHRFLNAMSNIQQQVYNSPAPTSAGARRLREREAGFRWPDPGGRQERQVRGYLEPRGCALISRVYRGSSQVTSRG